MNKYSFKDLLSKEIIIEDNSEDTNRTISFQKIEIPKIQRDYAQGRDTELEVRNRFLNSIFTTLQNGEIHDMDFIYGSVDEKQNTFILLDGQQRLTTLFLLYCYVGSSELSNLDFDELRKYLEKFTYSTRVSSRDFCKKLVGTKFNGDKTPSETITNLSWFFQSYEKDPTIKSMINMLDTIHEKYIQANNKSLFNNLQNLQFYILVLDGFNLSEELYVKMNARGKQLTDFENFKADLENWMKDDKNKYKETFQEMTVLNKRKLQYYHAFSQKIDIYWTNFFWNMTKNYNIDERDKKGNLLYPEGKIVDPLFMKIFYRYFLNKLILLSKEDGKIIDKTDDYVLLSKENKYQNFNAFAYTLSKENLLIDFEMFFDLLSENWKDIVEIIQPSWQEESKQWSFLDKTITLSDRVVFLGILQYLETNKIFNRNTFRQWMRVLWNIVENTDIDSVSSMVSAMKLIDELSPHAHEIYQFLADENNIINSSSSKAAIIEERNKASFIVNNSKNTWEQVFIAIEKHSFFKGSVGFIMTDSMTMDEFLHRSNMAFSVFDNKGINKRYRDSGHIFLRALISQYTESKDILKQNFTDQDESEHYLKKMLSSNSIIRKAIREWFSLEDTNELDKKLNDVINKDSELESLTVRKDSFGENQMRRAHEALYREATLQNWMQKNKAIYFDIRWSHLYIRRPRSWRDWVMLDSVRNKIITYMLSKNFTTEHQIEYQEELIPYYWGNDEIEVFGTIDSKEIRLTFNSDKDLIIDIKSHTGVWKEFYSCNYVKKDIKLKQILDKKLFNMKNFQQKINEVL